MIVGLLTLIIWIAVIGLVICAITAIVPMPAPFKTVIYVIGALICLLLLLNALGAADLPRLRLD